MMKKLISMLVLLIMIIGVCSPVMALTINTGDDSSKQPSQPVSTTNTKTGTTTLELVEKKLCEISLKNGNEVIGKFTKELSKFDADKKEVELTLKVENLMKDENAEKPVEVLLVLDNSNSMNAKYNQKEKKEYVKMVSNLFVDSLFGYFKDVKVGVVAFAAITPTTVGGKYGSAEDAKLLTALSNSKDTVKNAINNSYVPDENTACTNIESGLDLAQKSFSSSTETTKYVVLISDGVPNVSLAPSDTPAYSGEAATRTKAKLQTLEQAGYHIFSVLMGLNDSDKENAYAPKKEDGHNMTNRELSEEVFGTIENPTAGDFYYIDYDSLDTTVNGKILNGIKDLKDTSITNIVIKDYFPKEIVDNFNFTYVKSPNIGEVSSKIDNTDNSITWNIELLKYGEVAELVYKLTLKDDYNKEIVDKILQTNSGIDLKYQYGTEPTEEPTYKEFSTIRVKYKETNTTTPSTPKDPDKSKDPTESKDPIPQAGIYNTIIIIALVGIASFGIMKVVQIKKLY